MAKTGIEWTEYTWNPVTGCTKISIGCMHCYAEPMAKRLAGRAGYPKDDPFRVTMHPDRLGYPYGIKKASMIFVCSMSDLFHESVPFSYIDQVFNVMRMCPQHTFQVLTKREKRMSRFLSNTLSLNNYGYLPNVWLGITTEDQENYNKRIDIFTEIGPYREYSDGRTECIWTKFISAEPLLSPISLTDHVKFIDQIIVGFESGPNRRPGKMEWMYDLKKQCEILQLPLFVKQIDKIIPIPDDLMIKQYPKKKEL
jgi:protein gp37